MRRINQSFPLIAEAHPEDYHGYEFITLIRYNDENYLSIVDNVVNNQIVAYILDFCGPTSINEEHLIEVVDRWYQKSRSQYPVSIEFSRLGIVESLTPILRCLPIDYVSRVIGPLPEFNMGGPFKVKKRKKKSIPNGVEFIDKRLRKKPAE